MVALCALFVMFAALPGAASASNGLVITGETLDELRAQGALVHASVGLADGRTGRAISFSEGGIECPMQGALSAASGSIDLWCQMPQNWPAEEVRTLFHVGEEAHVHVTLFFRAGRLNAVYKGGKEHYASIHFPQSRSWRPNTWHRIQFWWEADGAEVIFFLRVDEQVAGTELGKTIERWPGRFFVGVRGPRGAPWHGLLEDVRVSSAPLKPPELQPGHRTIHVYADREVGPCYDFWSTVNFTSQDMFARPEARQQIRRRNPFMKHVNCVRLIGGRHDGKNRFFLGVDADGQPRCDFSPMISYLRGMLDWGYTPRIVLDKVPTAMSEPETMHKYGNTYPPKDHWLYHSYIQAVIRAMVDEFGMDVVRNWRFRVATEPDLFPHHWAGTKEEFLKLYDFVVDAVTRVIPDADIGPGNVLNPAKDFGGREPWGLDIIDHAARGTNHCTGETGTRLRFISCSWYGQVGRPIDSFQTAIEKMRARLHAYPQFRGLPVEVAEFAVLLDEKGRRLWCGDATEWAASWFAAIADLVYRLRVARVHQWATTAGGVPVPRTHVLSMLERMAGGQLLEVAVQASSSARCEAIACRKDDHLFVLVYNHRPLRRPKVPESVTLRIHDPRMLASRRWKVSELLVDEDHGGFIRAFYKDCEAAGIEPLPGAAIFEASISKGFGPRGVRLLHGNSGKYTRMARPLQTRTDEPTVAVDGELVLELNMPGHSVRFLDIRPAAAEE